MSAAPNHGGYPHMENTKDNAKDSHEWLTDQWVQEHNKNVFKKS